MPAPRLDLGDVARTAEAVQRLGSYAAAAAELGIPANTVKSRIRRAREIAMETIAPVVEPAPKPEPYRLGGSAQDRKVIKLQDENQHLRNALKEAHRQSLDDDGARELLGLLGAAPSSPPDWLGRAKAKKASKTLEVLMTSWADFHAGEVVSFSETNGVNEYSLDIFDARFRRLVDNTIDIATNHGPGVYAGAVINAVGDWVSGGLHPELQKTDEVEVLGAVLHVRDIVAWGLRRMADAFGRVYVPCVAGNHGRSTHKPEFKRYAYKNFDWLIYQLLIREFAGDDRITFDVRPSNEVFYSVYGHRFLLMHGDMLGVKGGDGIIGALGPIARGEVKVRGFAASSGMAYDTLLMGHWHQQLWLPRAIVANTLKGYDEYAKNALRAGISAPSQPLWFLHPERGITSRWEVAVEEPKKGPLADWVSVFNPTERAAA